MQESSLAKIPQVDMKLELDNPPTCEEIKKATMQLKLGKSSGIDGIPAEVLSAQGRSSARLASGSVHQLLVKKGLYCGNSGM